MKLFPKNRILISLLSSSISSAFLLSPTYAMDPPLKEEELNKFSLSRALPLAVRERLGDIFSFQYYNTAHGLLQSSNPEERLMGAAALRKIAKKRDHPDNHRASADLFSCAQFCLSCGTEEDKKIGVAIYRELAENKDNPYSSCAAGALYSDAVSLHYSDSKDNKRSGAIALRQIAQDPLHQNYFDAAQILVQSDNEGNKIIGVAALRQIAQDSSHTNYYTAVQALFSYGTEEDKRAVAPIIYGLVQDHENANDFSLASSLFWSPNEEDKRIGSAVLKEIAQDPLHPNYFEAAQDLYNNGSEEDKRLVAPTIYKRVQDHENPMRYYLASNLFWSPNEDDKIIGTAVLKEIAQDPSNPNYSDAAQILSTTDAGLADFREIIKDSSNPNYSDAAEFLFYNGSEEDKRAVAPIIYGLVQDLKNANCFSLALNLVSSDNQEDQEIAFAALREIIQDPTNPNYYDAMLYLCDFGTKEDKKIGMNICKEVIKDSTHLYYYDAARIFFQSKNEGNRTIGMHILNEIVQDPSHPDYPDAAQVLANSFCSEEHSDATLLNLLPAFSLEILYLEGLLLKMLESPNLEIQKRAETIFLDNPLKIFTETHLLEKFTALLITHEEEKKNFWLHKICEALHSSSGEDASHFNAACLVLKTSDQEKFTGIAKTVFLKLLDTQEEEFMLRAKSLLQAVQDTDLKEKIVSRLFKIAKSIDLKDVSEEAFGPKASSLVILLEQNDKKIRTEAVSLCQELLASIDPSHELPEKFLSRIGAVLCDMEEGKSLAQQISLLLQPKFEQILSASDPWDEHFSLVEFFMRMGSESQQLKIFNLLKESIINIEDESSTESENSDENGSESDDDYNNFEDGIDIIILTLGVDHLWSQELIELGAKRVNSNHKSSPFTVYKQLREQMGQPVKHLLPQLQLKDKRTVTFNLNTLRDKRKIFHLPMKHDEFVSFTKQLLVQADQHPKEFKLCATEALRINRQTAMEEANTVFFKSLLDTDDQKKDPQNLSLTSFKLRHILTAAQELERQESKGLASQELPPSSKLILSLLNNVLTCPTGKEDGIDQTYRLLTNCRGSSENELQQERLKEEMHEFFKEEMRCLRETLLSGNGPVVRSLLKLSKESKIEEPPHQAKYLGNLLGGEIGSFPEGKSITFDPNGGCVLSKLRECSKQKALDKLYKYHTPQTAIAYFHELLNSKGIMGKIDGKNTLATIMGEFLTYEQQGDSAYIVFDASDTPIGLTPLGVAEILLKTHILEVVKKD